MKTDIKKADAVFQILESMLRNSPEASYQRLNPALRDTLANCISADLPFQADTFQRIYGELRGQWWFGDGAGSSMGEHFYTQAVGLNHASAYQSFEQFAGRPGVLWEEDANISARLHVGAKFTWKGMYLTVTSMRADSLVACSYKEVESAGDGIKVGHTVGRYNEPYIITASNREGAATVLRVIKSKPVREDRTVLKRVTISYEEIAEFRRTVKARLKVILAKIAGCDPAKYAKALTKEINAEHFRHFQLEEVEKAFSARKDWVANQGRIDAWRKGDGDAWLDIKTRILRVKGDSVQCSNGNSVSVAAVRRVLPILLDRRGQSFSPNLSLDGYTINRVDSKGMTIGCTFVEWSEVDLVNKALEAIAA